MITRKLQWFVAGLLGVWGLFILSFFMAFSRASQAERLQGKPYKSFTLQESVLLEPQRGVVQNRVTLCGNSKSMKSLHGKGFRD